MRFALPALLALVTSLPIGAAQLNLPDAPLFISGSKNALVQLVMQRDNKLFFEGYPSYVDINQDGVLDIKYKPQEIDYYGYFDSEFCYSVVGGDHLEAVAIANDKKCSGHWSGDFLNYVSMTRMDLMLRTLYGGRRVVDEPGNTRLRRAFVPWENHTWGIEYTSPSVDEYLITDYTPLAQPASGKRHHFATNNILKNDVPYLRVRTNTNQRIWQWVDKERSQGDGSANMDIILDVTVCKDGFLEDNCQQYPDGGYKPIGLLHEYGENDSMYFSLITGSYENNLQGGVLRQPMASFGQNEVNPNTGVFTDAEGIVHSLNALQIPNNFENNTVQKDCGWIYNRPFQNGECKAWGNPIAEMMYEGMRYFSGVGSDTSTSPETPEFKTSGGMDADLGLAAPAWGDPYAASQPYAQCSGAYQLVISDPSPSFDGDQLPGSYFNNFTSSSLGDLHVGDLADDISQHEDELPGLKFIGESGADNDGTPTPKQVTTFRTIRGQSPEAPHRQGSYYASSVAYYGHQNDIHPGAPGKQNVRNYTLALGTPLPSINVEVAGQTISFAPFAKTVNFCNRNTSYRPTNAIVGFNVEEISDTSGSFRVSYEDMEQGADNDMDAVARYSYTVENGTVIMTVDSLTASGCAIQHMGYTVSGTTSDGVYLVIRDSDTRASADTDSPHDVPPGASPGSGWDDGVALPLTSTISFIPSMSPAAEQLQSPLWYAAKWGGFNDQNGDGIPQKMEWDSNDDGYPDNYFPVTDPSTIGNTMRAAFNQITEEIGAATAIASVAGSLRFGDKIYRAQFQSGSWTGELSAQRIGLGGAISATPLWNASERLAEKIANNGRQILTYNPASKTGIPFRWPSNPAAPLSTELHSSQVSALARNPITGQQDGQGEKRLQYIRGTDFDDFRTRNSALGDIIHSNPALVGPPAYFYRDNWGSGAPENTVPYSDFADAYNDRRRVVYVGANDGMLHAFDAGEWSGTHWTDGDGSELFAYVPSPVYQNLPELTSIGYAHKYYVDGTPTAGDVFINGSWRTVLIGGLRGGGQGIYALDVTEPETITESTARDTVLWEFSDFDDQGVGYTYSNPVIARMHNGKWAAIIANGYNNSEQNVGYRRGGGWASVIIIDIETGARVKKLFSAAAQCRGSGATPNSMTEPTAVDLDGDNIVDKIYTGDLYGCVTGFDVSSSNPNDWARGELKHRALDSNGNPMPITAPVKVGSHPTGEGVMLYFGTGKYLEPSDQYPAATARRFYAIWDKGDGKDTAQLSRISAGNLLQQRITNEQVQTFDTDGDGEIDRVIETRETSQEVINWDHHLGWYMDLAYQTNLGEQVVAAPVIRDGRILFNTHIPVGNECVPDQGGWLMALNAADGSMLNTSPFDINGDGLINDSGASGIKGRVNSLSNITVVAAGNNDLILSQSETDPVPTTTALGSSFVEGRITWLEKQP
jgi:type IV pilus assembly protein PilY1